MLWTAAPEGLLSALNVTGLSQPITCLLDADDDPPVDLASPHVIENAVDVVELVHAVVGRDLAFAGKFE